MHTYILHMYESNMSHKSKLKKWFLKRQLASGGYAHYPGTWELKYYSLKTTKMLFHKSLNESEFSLEFVSILYYY